MFVARLVEGPDIRVFGRGIGLAHRPGRDDATQADIQLREWKSVLPRYVRVHDTEFVDGTLANGVSLGELMDSLGSRCFASTASHAQTGQGNTNPRRAIRQQSAMELTQEGVEWLSQKLERSFEVHGQIQETTLNSLDWPVVASNKEEVNRD